MNRHLIIVRHSLPEIEQDLPARQWHLSQDGNSRAVRLAEKLLSYQLDLVATSQEPKALETARIVAKKCGADLQEFEGLHEHERSAVPYLSKTEFESSVRQFFEKPDMLVFGSETASQAYARFSKAVSSILERHEDKRIAIVSHGTVISLFAARLTGQPGFQLWSELGLPSFVVLDLDSRKLITLENIL